MSDPVLKNFLFGFKFFELAFSAWSKNQELDMYDFMNGILPIDNNWWQNQVDPFYYLRDDLS